MAKAKKCRAADDLLFASETHPSFTQVRMEFARVPTQDLQGVMTGTAPLIERAVALRYLLGTDRRSSKQLLPRRGESQAVFDGLIRSGVSPYLISVAREAYRKTGEPLAPVVALLSREPGWDTGAIVDDVMLPEVMIGSVPGCAYDMFTREGRATFSRFLGTDATTAKWVCAHVAPAKRVDMLGKLVFFVEGDQMRHRLRWPIGDELRRQAGVECLGCPDAIEPLKLMLADLPLMNALRLRIVQQDPTISQICNPE